MTTPDHRHTYWHSQARNPLADKIARYMAEHGARLDHVDSEGPHFHHIIRAALQAPDETATLTALIEGLADMQESLIVLLKLAEAEAKSRLSHGILLSDPIDPVILRSLGLAPSDALKGGGDE